MCVLSFAFLLIFFLGLKLNFGSWISNDAYEGRFYVDSYVGNENIFFSFGSCLSEGGDFELTDSQKIVFFRKNLFILCQKCLCHFFLQFFMKKIWKISFFVQIILQKLFKVDSKKIEFENSVRVNFWKNGHDFEFPNWGFSSENVPKKKASLNLFLPSFIPRFFCITNQINYESNSRENFWIIPFPFYFILADIPLKRSSKSPSPSRSNGKSQSINK